MSEVYGEPELTASPAYLRGIETGKLLEQAGFDLLSPAYLRGIETTSFCVTSCSSSGSPAYLRGIETAALLRQFFGLITVSSLPKRN